MNNHRGRIPFLALTAATLISLLLIIINALLGLAIPFTVHFLIAFVSLMFLFVVWHAVLTKGWKRTLLMITVSFLTAFTAEALGVNFGLIFGKYHYTEALGFQVFGVPLLAAFAWEPIVYASFCLTDILAPSMFQEPSNWRKRLPPYFLMSAIAALATTAWDMMIDPIAVSQGWWVWHQGGEYLPYVANGVPIQNFIGWLGVSFVINVFFRIISDGSPNYLRSLDLSIKGPITLYSALFLTSFGVCITILKRPEVALIGLLAMGPFLAIALTNINLIRQGLATLLGSGWLDLEIKNGRIKAGN
jgi:uncharacterized membrane protein